MIAETSILKGLFPYEQKLNCTISLFFEDKETLIALCKAGMNVARLIFPRSTYPEHQKNIDHIKQVQKEPEVPIRTMFTTEEIKGNECRSAYTIEASLSK